MKPFHLLLASVYILPIAALNADTGGGNSSNDPRPMAAMAAVPMAATW